VNPGLNKIALLASADLSQAEVALQRIPNDLPGLTFSQSVIDQVKSGRYKLCEVLDNGEQIGFTVFFIDEQEGFREFVSVATKCFPNKILRYDLENLFIELARRHECVSMRLHTLRHGLVNTALQNGWHCAEIILRKPVTAPSDHGKE